MSKSKAGPQRCFLLIGQARKALVAETRVPLKDRRDQDIKTLYQLASDYDASDPPLAAQLRAIAGRL